MLPHEGLALRQVWQESSRGQGSRPRGRLSTGCESSQLSTGCESSQLSTG